MRKPKGTLRERQEEMRGRMMAERLDRRAYRLRLQTGTATEADMLRAAREGRIRTREDAKRAWGLL